MTPRTRGLRSVAWLGACLLAAAAARAEPPAGDDVRAQADAEFNEGKMLLEQGHTAEACARFAHSQQLDPKVGRLLNLAFCHEQEGKTASAWSEYNNAAALAAQKSQPDRVDFASDRAAAVAKKLSFVHLVLPPGASSVQLDGASIARERWQMPLPLDPGEHRLIVGGAGKKPTSVTVTVSTSPGVQELPIAALEDQPATAKEQPAAAAGAQPAQAAQQESPASRDAPGSRVPAYIAGGGGLVGLGVGIVGGVMAMSKKSQADANCPNKQCDPAGRALINEAQTAATVSTVGFGVGLAGAVAAVWLFVRAPSADASVARVTPVLGPRTAGIGLEGAW